MIKASCPVSPGLVCALEDLLCEMAPSNWCLVVNRLTGEGSLEGFFNDEAEALGSWHEIHKSLTDLEGEPDLEDLQDCDWKEAYKNHFSAWRMGSLHWVPEWERSTYTVPPEDQALYLDPGMAFGTGLHETTRLCLNALVSFVEKGEPGGKACIDAGCGSGILALSAQLLGFGEVKGFDIDPDAVRIALENARANGLEEVTTFETCGFNEGLLPESADLILANLQGDLLQDNAPLFLMALRTGGTLALSGILGEELESTTATFLRQSREMNIAIASSSQDKGEWSLLKLRRQ